MRFGKKVLALPDVKQYVMTYLYKRNSTIRLDLSFHLLQCPCNVWKTLLNNN